MDSSRSDYLIYEILRGSPILSTLTRRIVGISSITSSTFKKHIWAKERTMYLM